MSWFSRQTRRFREHQTFASSSQSAAPPEWAPAEEESRPLGVLSDAPEEEYEAAEQFCLIHPPNRPALLASYDVEKIQREGCKAWSVSYPGVAGQRFKGSIRDITSGKEGGPKVVEIESYPGCGDVCLMSNFPIMAGLYETQGKEGVYFEVTVVQMEGVVAIGTTCKPYPEYRLPGWNRLSMGLHLDDLQKFCEDPNGGRPYGDILQETEIQPGDVIGCGYEFRSTSLFYTYNGERLKSAFSGMYVPRQEYDVYAAIGVGGPGPNKLIVNFGGDDQDHLFRWKPGREWGWLVDGHVGRLSATSSSVGDELPTYEEVRKGY